MLFELILLAMGLVLVYWLPGLLLMARLHMTLWERLLLAPFTSIVFHGWLLGTVGLIAPFHFSKASGLLVLCGAGLVWTVLSRLNPPEKEAFDAQPRSPVRTFITCGCLVALPLLSGVAHAYAWLNLQPNVSDDMGRVAMLVSFDLWGVPAHHWLQPQAQLSYYFYFYIAPVLVKQWSGGILNYAQLWWLHVVILTASCCGIVWRLVAMWATTFRGQVIGSLVLTLGSSFGLLPALAVHPSFSKLPCWLRQINAYTGRTEFGTVTGNAIWAPQHFVGITCIALIFTILYRIRVQWAWRAVAAAFLLSYLAGCSTHLFAVFGFFLFLWWIESIIGWRWDEWKLLTATGAVTMAASIPFFMSALGQSGRLLWAPPGLSVSAIPLINYCAGVAIDAVFLFIQYGIVALGGLLLLRSNDPALARNRRMAWLAVVAVLPFIHVGTGRFKEINDLTGRGLLGIYAILALLALHSLEDWNGPRRVILRWIATVLLAYSLLPPLASFAGTTWFMRKMEPVAKVTKWINRNLPLDAVVVPAESLLAKSDSPDPMAIYSRVVFNWAERQKWIRYSRLIDPELGVMKERDGSEEFPVALLKGRSIYLLYRPRGGVPPGISELFRDQEHALGQFGVTTPDSIARVVSEF